MQIDKAKNNAVRLMVPAICFGALTGFLTAVLVVLYKFCAVRVMEYSAAGYHWLREHPIWIFAVLAGLCGIAFLFAYLYRYQPNLRGGGIPTAIGNLRGILPIRGVVDLIGIYFLSLTSFFFGLPLGNEGPSVQMGTAVGKISVGVLSKKHRAWDRYAMTGGACAGFSVATGATISGILFSVEEAHRRISPMLLIFASVSVTFAEITNQFLSPLLGVSTTLFPAQVLRVIAARELWLPLLIGVAVGLFSVAFLKYYRLISQLFNKTLEKIPHGIRIFIVLALTLGVGIASHSFISTGHHLILSLFEGKTVLWMLVLILFVRSTLTICANSNSLTGDTVLPILALGALLTSILAKLLIGTFGLEQDYYTVIFVLGITGCMAGMMKMPLTAIVFSVEALSCHANIFSVIVVAVVAFLITEIFNVHSINDHDLETRIKEYNAGKRPVEIDDYVVVREGSFAVGKQIRDVLWPDKLTVLSFQHAKKQGMKSKADGGKEMQADDILHVHCTTYDKKRTMEELNAIIGTQKKSRSKKTS